MNKYYFNYEITGQKTILPLFIAVNGANKVDAYQIASKYLLSLNKNTIVYDKEYEQLPKDMANKYSVKTIPETFYKNNKIMPTTTTTTTPTPATDMPYGVNAKKRQMVLVVSTGVGLLGGYLISTKIFGKENHFARMAGTIVGGIIGFVAPDMITDLTTPKNTDPGKPIQGIRTS